MGGGVGERLLLVQNKTRLPRNPSHTPASWHKPWSAMTPIGAERRRWFAFSPTQRLLVSSSCHWVMTTLPRVCCTQGQHTVSVADVFEGAATTGMHALITRHGMTVGRRLVRRARKKKNNCRCVGEGSGAAICEHCARCVALGIPSHVVGRLLLRLVSASQLNEDHLVQFRARVAGPSRAARKARPGQGGLAQRWAGSWQISPSPQRPRISTAVSPVGSHGLFCFLPPVRTKGPVSRH